MTETEFLQQIKILFDAIESKIENLDADLDVTRHGSVLEIENDKGHQVVVNQQAAIQEVWLASREGGYHFKWVDGWVNTRSGECFDLCLENALATL